MPRWSSVRALPEKVDESPDCCKDVYIGRVPGIHGYRLLVARRRVGGPTGDSVSTVSESRPTIHTLGRLSLDQDADPSESSRRAAG